LKILFVERAPVDTGESLIIAETLM
jgi:hypothetical protein